MSATKDRLVVAIDEWTVPAPRRMRGTITIELGPVFAATHQLHANGTHEWRPIAPIARCAISFDRPAMRWAGRAYVDMNAGSEPLEQGFRSWTWARQEAGDSTAIAYDILERNGASRSLALCYRPDGSIDQLPAGPVQKLPTTGWRVARTTRPAGGQAAQVIRTLEDAPFYARSLLRLGSRAHETRAIHESVDLDRFASRWVQILLPFRMPRRAR
ncbi:MAG: hypothetical protein JNL61_18340 [Rhizobiaceae bacterium]|nr:hypothetical protein [Rhizobiaceae bacterium]